MVLDGRLDTDYAQLYGYAPAFVVHGLIRRVHKDCY
jgi:hypothetical protein